MLAKCHLKQRDGWTKTITHEYTPGTNIVIPFKNPPQPVKLGLGSFEPDAIYTKVFRPKRQVTVYDYDTRKQTIEFWFEEI